ncbi:hypothetical protein MCA2282 [Methylococcus capsulatus str. Bath]|uniref:Uncharacterized protein n=1 Tax=Methylococcus capsulatus (strain ATCC 33009 / NCIMB 11132 / Bath) TaxID=243233 RepID=Q605K0_METCA|nr:hypothetical protein MCA2282 [Methylococcus capsulatus str. Bath]
MRGIEADAGELHDRQGWPRRSGGGALRRRGHRGKDSVSAGLGQAGPARMPFAPDRQLPVQRGLVLLGKSLHRREHLPAFRDVGLHRAGQFHQPGALVFRERRAGFALQQGADGLEPLAVLRVQAAYFRRAQHVRQRGIEVLFLEGDVGAGRGVDALGGLARAGGISAPQALRKLVKAPPEHGVVLAECVEQVMLWWRLTVFHRI